MSNEKMEMQTSPIEEILADYKSGQMVILVDDEDRENEGDLVMAADKVSPEAINFMAVHGRGLVCVSLTPERVEELGLHMMVRDNASPYGTAFTVSIEGMGRDESDQLLADLHEHCTRPEFQIRYRWAPHDVLLWDNRRIQHFAIWDYWPHERSGHRVTVRGTRPFFDPDGPEPEESPIRVSIGRLA